MPYTVLVVDDNASNRELITTLLDHRGDRSIEADNGEEALRQARSHGPDLIICDILMPSMDGYEFVRQLRADPLIAHTEVIFYSAHYRERQARRLAQACGVSRVLVKPCEPEEILRAIEAALAHAQPTRSVTVAEGFERAHMRLMTDKLIEKVSDLEHEIVERKASEDKVKRLNRVYAVLSGINNLIVRVHDRDELFREACRIAVEAGDFELAWIGIADSHAVRDDVVTWSGKGDGPTENLRLVAGLALAEEGEAGRDAPLQAVPIIYNDVIDSPNLAFARDDLLARNCRSIACFPLVLNGHPHAVFALCAAEPGVFDEAEVRLLGELAGDISFALDHIEKEHKLHYLAYYDALTGLANDTLLRDRLERFLEAARRDKCGLALLLLDIEQFKTLNDVLGRHGGDLLLNALARRLEGNPAGAGAVARIGSDRFAVIVPEIRTDAEVAHILDGYLHVWLDQPISVAGASVRVSARVGISLFPNDGSDAQGLVANAEAALKKAKATGDRYLFYAEQMTARVNDRLALESKLRQAIDNGEFVLYYQPKVDLASRRIEAVEALIRWISPELGLVAPVEFISLLEETGLIVRVGAWALRQAVQDQLFWHKQGVQEPRVAVNVSSVQLRQKKIIGMVRDALSASAAHDLPPAIDIELTESLIMEDVDASIEMLTSLCGLGVNIAIDDFGTGYSSLAYLAKLPVHALKIDRYFIESMINEPNGMMLVSTIISLAHAMRLKVIAEGVETEEHAKILRLLRCDEMQGYLISQPVTREAMLDLLQRQAGAPTVRH
jgi:diguanylate cyclase (GGDEF)-like protein